MTNIKTNARAFRMPMTVNGTVMRPSTQMNVYIFDVKEDPMLHLGIELKAYMGFNAIVHDGYNVGNNGKTVWLMTNTDSGWTPNSLTDVVLGKGNPVMNNNMGQKHLFNTNKAYNALHITNADLTEDYFFADVQSAAKHSAFQTYQERGWQIMRMWNQRNSLLVGGFTVGKDDTIVQYDEELGGTADNISPLVTEEKFVTALKQALVQWKAARDELIRDKVLVKSQAVYVGNNGMFAGMTMFTGQSASGPLSANNLWGNITHPTDRNPATLWFDGFVTVNTEQGVDKLHPLYQYGIVHSEPGEGRKGSERARYRAEVTSLNGNPVEIDVTQISPENQGRKDADGNIIKTRAEIFTEVATKCPTLYIRARLGVRNMYGSTGQPHSMKFSLFVDNYFAAEGSGGVTAVNVAEIDMPDFSIADTEEVEAVDLSSFNDVPEQDIQIMSQGQLSDRQIKRRGGKPKNERNPLEEGAADVEEQDV